MAASSVIQDNTASFVTLASAAIGVRVHCGHWIAMMRTKRKGEKAAIKKRFRKAGHYWIGKNKTAHLVEGVVIE